MTLPTGSYAPLIEEFVAERAVSETSTSPQTLIFAAIERFPNAKAIEAAFAFVCVASALEPPSMFSEGVEQEFVSKMHRAIAVFSADIYAVEALHGPSPTCSQIRDFWLKTGERFFA